MFGNFGSGPFLRRVCDISPHIMHFLVEFRVKLQIHPRVDILDCTWYVILGQVQNFKLLSCRQSFLMPAHGFVLVVFGNHDRS